MNRGVRNDWREAASAATADLWRRAEAAKPTPAPTPTPEPYTDPTCRFAKSDPSHACHRRDGSPLTYKTDCHAEARAQIADQAAASQAKVAAGGGGPKYRDVTPRTPVPRRIREAHADCPSSAMEYTSAGARCTSCGTTWPMTRNDEGKPVGYLSVPNTSGNADQFRSWCD